MQDSRTRVQEGDLEVGIGDSEEMQAVHRVDSDEAEGMLIMAPDSAETRATKGEPHPPR